MSLQNINPTTTNAWMNLRKNFEKIEFTHLQNFFENENRVNEMHIEWEDFLLDFSKNRLDNDTFSNLIALADEVNLKDAISKYFGGENINVTENRAVLHTALRARKEDNLSINGINVMPEIYEVKESMKVFCDEIISGNAKGFTGKSFTDVVNIGIGGSDLGPAMVVEALQFYKNHLNVHFVSNVDGDHVQEIIKKLNPETTLFVIVSKTFTTQETLSNAETIKNWFLKYAKANDVSKHFVAVSTNISKVTAFGISENNIFPMWDWVGGRFSLWSAVGLSIALAVGYDNFDKMLQGANKMDNHFKNSRFNKNIPVVLALLSVWYNNFFNAQSHAIICYSQYLQKLSSYLQQGIMESNGKSIDRNGFPVNYQTGNIIWGEPGTNSQHAFFQLIHQGTKLIPCDFIGFKKSLYGNKDHQDKLMSNFFAQTEALMNGKNEEIVIKELQKQGLSEKEIKKIAPFKEFSGNKPTNTLLIEQLTPESLGKLIAMYEHKIFTEGIIWNIYSYDQWGVELGKQLANNVLNEINSNEIKKHDSSTSFLLKKYLN
jgi:glucose-6-phosphate isomerase